MLASLCLPSAPRAQFGGTDSGFPKGLKASVCQANNLTDCTLQYLNVAPPTNSASTFDIVVQLGSATYTLRVAYHSIRGPQFKILSKPDLNTTNELPIPPVRTVRGTVLEWPNSYVTGVFRSGGFYGRARNTDNGDSLRIRPVDVVGMPSNLYFANDDAQALPTTGLGDCSVGDDQGIASSDSIPATGESSFPTGLQGSVTCYSGDLLAMISMDSNSGYWAIHGDDLVPIMEDTANLSSLMLERAMGLRNLLDEVVVRPDPAGDPYALETSGDDMRALIKSLWSDRYEERNLALVAALHDQALGNPGTASQGSADTAGVCESHNLETLGYMCHEIGHVWGAGHCTDLPCACPGANIMSANGLTQPYLQCSIDEMLSTLHLSIRSGRTQSDLFDNLELLIVDETDVNPIPVSPVGASIEMPQTIPGYITGNEIGIKNLGNCALDFELRLNGGSSAFTLEGPTTAQIAKNDTHFFSIRFANNYVGTYATTVEVEITNLSPVPLKFWIPVSVYNSPGSALPGPFAAVNTMAPFYDWNKDLNDPPYYLDWSESSNAETYQYSLSYRSTQGGSIEFTKSDPKRRSSVSNKFTLQDPGSFCGFAPGFWNWTIVAENENGTRTIVGPIFEVTNADNLPLSACNDGGTETD